MTESFAELAATLRTLALRCVQPPQGRFRHPWLAPMPARAASPEAAAEHRDHFAIGDYAGGLFHHDVAEAAIEHCRDPQLALASWGSLLCFLDCAAPDGCIHRIELPHGIRDAEPAKPVMAQLALRMVGAPGVGLAMAEQHGVLAKLVAFVEYLERGWFGPRGLLVTPSARASGFDSDILSAGLPERSVEGPDTSTFMVLEYRALAELAFQLGKPQIGATMRTRADALAARIDEALWCEAERTYVALRCDARGADAIVGVRDPDGVRRPLASWITLLPLLAGIPSAERAAVLFDALLDPARYWGPAGVRTTPADDPFFQQAPRVMIYDPRKGERGPVSNWSGPVWVLANYYMFCALRRYGRDADARRLALVTARLLAADLRATGALHECYDDRGRGLWPQRGTFISWNVLALTMLRESEPSGVTGP